MKYYAANFGKSMIFSCIALFYALSSIGQGKSDSLVNEFNNDLKNIMSVYGEELHKSAYIDSLDKVFIIRAKNNPYKLSDFRDSLVSELHKEYQIYFVGWVHYELGDIIKKRDAQTIQQVIRLTIQFYKNDTTKVLKLYPELKPYIKQ